MIGIIIQWFLFILRLLERPGSQPSKNRLSNYQVDQGKEWWQEVAPKSDSLGSNYDEEERVVISKTATDISVPPGRPRTA